MLPEIWAATALLAATASAHTLASTDQPNRSLVICGVGSARPVPVT